MKKRLLSIILVLCLMLSLLPIAAFATDTDENESAAASEGTYYSYKDIVRRTYDMSYLATPPKAGEGGKQVTSRDPASTYNEETGLYEYWGDSNLDMTGYPGINPDNGYRMLANLEGPGYLNRIWIGQDWEINMHIWIDGELVVDTTVIDFVRGSYFSRYDELSFKTNYVNMSGFEDGYQGASNLFVPIPYNESCIVEVDLKERDSMYYIVGYYDLEDGASVESFTWPMSEENHAALAEANAALKDETVPYGETIYSDTVQPGETVTLYESATAGAISATTMKIDIPRENFDDQTSLTQWVINMYWDDAQTPAVSLPVADFYGNVYGLYQNEWDAVAFGTTADQVMYSQWYMPFNAAKITLTNNSATARQVDATFKEEALTDEQANGLTRFHANWQRSYTRYDDRWPDAHMLYVEGEGRFVGTNLHIYQIIDRIWWGEGDEKFFIDGEKMPTWFGTGSEDYFCYAWCDSGQFDFAYCGQPINDDDIWTGDYQVQMHGDKMNYRIHLLDSICFHESFDANIEKYYNEESASYAATTFFYLTKETSGNHVAVCPTAEERIFNNDILTGETTFYPGAYLISRKIADNTAVEPVLQGMINVHDTYEWFGDVQLFWTPTSKDKYMEFLLELPETDEYQIVLSKTHAYDYGTYAFYLDGELLDEEDFFAPSLDQTNVVLDTRTVTKGEHILKVVCTGKNYSSAGYILGLHYLEFISTSDITFEPETVEQYFGGSVDLLAMLSGYQAANAPVDQGLDPAISDNGSHMFWLSGVGDTAHFSFSVPENGYYDLTAAYTCFTDFGKFELLLDGVKIGETYDAYSTTLAVKTATIEDVPILKGEHTLSLRCVSKNDASVGTVLGIDYISLKGETTADSLYQDVSAYYRGSADLLRAMTEYTSTEAPIDQGVDMANGSDDGSHLFWYTAAQGTSLSFTVTVPQTTTYDLTVGKTCAGDFGKFDVSVDGTVVGTLDFFNGAVTVTPSVIHDLELNAGEHTLTFTCVGKNDTAWGTLMGIDYLRFDGVIGDKPFVPEEFSQYFKGSSQLLGMISSYTTSGGPVDQGLDATISDDGSHLFWAPAVGDELGFTVEAPENGYYDFEIAHTCFGDFGKYDILLDGTKIGELDGYSASLAVSKVILTDVPVLQGAHVLSFKCTGKNDASSGVVFGLDYITMNGISTDEPISQDVSSYYRGSADLLRVLESYTSTEAPHDQGLDPAISDDGSHLFWRPAVGESATYTITVPQTATYDLTVAKTCAGDFGQYEVYVDGNKVGDVLDFFSTVIKVENSVIEGIELTAGEHTLTFTCVGKNDAAWGTLMGIDYLRFDGVIDNVAEEEPGDDPIPDNSDLFAEEKEAAKAELEAYAEAAYESADSDQEAHILRAVAVAKVAICQAATAEEVAQLLAEAKAEIDTILATTYEEELEIDSIDSLLYEGADMVAQVIGYTSPEAPIGQGCGTAWSRAAHLFWCPTAVGQELEISIEVPYDCEYEVSFAYTICPDYGAYDVYLGETKLCSVDSYGEMNVASVDCGTIYLTAGTYTLKLVVIGKNAASPAYYVGIDHLELTCVGENLDVLQYRAAACKYLDNYKDIGDYSAEQWEIVQNVIEEQKAIINACATVDEILAAWKAAKTALDAVESGLVEYDNLVFDATKTPADFAWNTDDNNYTNWSVTEDGRTMYVAYTGTDSKRIWKDLIEDPENFTVTLEAKVGEKRAYIELFGQAIELNCERGSGSQIFDRESWSWFAAENQVCYVTIARADGGDLSVKLQGKGNPTPVTFTKSVIDAENSNLILGVYDVNAAAYFSDIAVTGVEAQTVDNFGWDTDEIGGSKDFSGWTSLDGTDITAVYADTTGNHRIWKGLVEDQNNFTVYADFSALTESSAYIKLLGQTLELDARNGNGAQLGVKLNGTFRDWIAAENLNAQVYLTRVNGDDIAVTIVTNGKTTKAEYTLSPSESSENVELGIYAGTVTFADLAVTEPETEVEVLKNPGDFGWESDSEDFSGWTATDEANLSVTYDQTVNGRVWKGLLSDLNNFTIDLDVTNDNTSSTYIKVLGVTVELDSNNG
ncbi:MAG: DUF2961 domain-containing protein, partial [Oscillospiraceae bacterium]|nr:DUF2961 domain-containing protein [Oscillospiraceae bacterium]